MVPEPRRIGHYRLDFNELTPMDKRLQFLLALTLALAAIIGILVASNFAKPNLASVAMSSVLTSLEASPLSAPSGPQSTTPSGELGSRRGCDLSSSTGEIRTLEIRLVGGTSDAIPNLELELPLLRDVTVQPFAPSHLSFAMENKGVMKAELSGLVGETIIICENDRLGPPSRVSVEFGALGYRFGLKGKLSGSHIDYSMPLNLSMVRRFDLQLNIFQSDGTSGHGELSVFANKSGEALAAHHVKHGSVISNLPAVDMVLVLAWSVGGISQSQQATLRGESISSQLGDGRRLSVTFGINPTPKLRVSTPPIESHSSARVVVNPIRHDGSGMLQLGHLIGIEDATSGIDISSLLSAEEASDLAALDVSYIADGRRSRSTRVSKWEPNIPIALGPAEVRIVSLQLVSNKGEPLTDPTRFSLHLSGPVSFDRSVQSNENGRIETESWDRNLYQAFLRPVDPLLSVNPTFLEDPSRPLVIVVTKQQGAVLAVKLGQELGKRVRGRLRVALVPTADLALDTWEAICHANTIMPDHLFDPGCEGIEVPISAALSAVRDQLALTVDVGNTTVMSRTLASVIETPGCIEVDYTEALASVLIPFGFWEGSRQQSWVFHGARTSSELIMFLNRRPEALDEFQSRPMPLEWEQSSVSIPAGVNMITLLRQDGTCWILDRPSAIGAPVAGTIVSYRTGGSRVTVEFSDAIRAAFSASFFERDVSGGQTQVMYWYAGSFSIVEPTDLTMPQGTWFCLPSITVSFSPTVRELKLADWTTKATGPAMRIEVGTSRIVTR